MPTKKDATEKLEAVSTKIVNVMTDEALAAQLTPPELVVAMADATHAMLNALEEQGLWPEKFKEVTPYESFTMQLLNARLHERLGQ